MRRLAAILLAIAVPSLLVMVPLLVTYQPGLPSAGRQALTFYLGYQQEAGLADLAVGQIEPAGNPRGYTADDSAATFGDGSYFVVNHDQAGLGAGDGNLRPLPYPPDDLWCAALGAGRVVFIAQHQDLYRSAWAVHETPAGFSAAELAGLLRRVGCPVPP